MKLFLDDIRQPQACVNYMSFCIGSLSSVYLEDWMIVKNYQEFIDAVILYHNQLLHISL